MKRLSLLIFTVFIALSVHGQKAKKISRDWTSISQKIDVEVDTIRKFKVIASVKVESEDESAWTGIWARVDNKPGKGSGFFDNMRDRRIKSNEWKSYVVTGNLDERSAELNFGGLIFNNGKFYYDKFEVFIEDENGEFQPIEIPNPSFETKIEDSYTIEGWSEGISTGETYRVKEFTVSSSEDSVDGNYSMLV